MIFFYEGVQQIHLVFKFRGKGVNFGHAPIPANMYGSADTFGLRAQGYKGGGYEFWACVF